MKILCLFFFIFTAVHSQLNMTVFSKMPNKTYSGGLIFSSIRNNNTDIFLSVKETQYDIVRWNVTDASNVSKVGTYAYTGYQSTIYSYVYFFKGFILACSNNNSPRVFNQSTYAFIGTLNVNLTFGRGEYLQSKNIFVFGTSNGKFGYFQVNTLPIVSVVYLFNSTNTGDFVFLQKSHDQSYITVSCNNNPYVNVWRVSDWTLLKNITVDSPGVYTQGWSSENRYLMVFLYSQTYVLVYDRDANWTLQKNVSIGYKNIRTNFYYNETGVVVALSEYSQAIITINWYDFSVTKIYSINGWKMYQSDDGKAMTVFQQGTVNTAWFFSINPYCTNFTTYNIPLKKCLATCTSNCQTCASATTCSVCNTNYTLTSNGSCFYSCLTRTFYNSTSSVCESCGSNCETCSSSSVCQNCVSGAYLVNFTCVSCPTGEVYNYTSWGCEANCVLHCATCLTTNFCSACVSNYQLINNSCFQCSNGTFYNSTTLICEDCPQNCYTCISPTNCTACTNGYHLNISSCINCPVGNIYNQNTSVCQPNCTKNCLICQTETTCLICETTYDLFQNGTCLQCPSGTVYDSNVDQCLTNSNSSLNGTIVYCTSNCILCQNATFCSVCDENFTLSIGQCLLKNQSKEFNNSTNQSNKSDTKYNTIYEFTMGMTVENDFIEILNKIPGSRRLVRQVFAFFLNIDHLWLYVYHKHQYGYYVNRLLKAVQNLEQEKWSLVSDQIFNKTLHVDLNVYAQYLNYKTNYTSWKYLEIQGHSSSFLQNSIGYFFLNVPLVLVLFFLLKFFYRLFCRYQVSLLFKQYAFNGYLLLMLMQGNCESFSYLFMYDSRQLTGSNFKEKVLNILTIFLFMLFFIHLIAGFFIIKSHYNENAKHFYDNCNDSLRGSVNLFVEYGLLNFCLGSAHIMLENSYNIQLLTLFLIETAFITFIICSIKKKKVYQFKYIQWMNIIASFLRICLIFTYYFDQKDTELHEVVDEVQMHLIIIYLLNWIVSTLAAYFILTFRLFEYFIKKLRTKSNISTHIVPSLLRYRNLARTEAKNKNVKIEIIDETPQILECDKKQVQFESVNKVKKYTVSFVPNIKVYKKTTKCFANFKQSKQFPSKDLQKKTSEELPEEKTQGDKPIIERNKTIAKSNRILLSKYLRHYQNQKTEQFYQTHLSHAHNENQNILNVFDHGQSLVNNSTNLTVSRNEKKLPKQLNRRRSITLGDLSKLNSQSYTMTEQKTNKTSYHKSIKLRCNKNELKSQFNGGYLNQIVD